MTLNAIRKTNRWYDNLKEPYRFFLAMALVGGSAVIGSFVFHSVAVYFILVLLLIAARKVGY